MLADILHDPLGTGSDGQPVYLRDIWPSTKEIEEVIAECVQSEMYTRGYADVYTGDDNWRSLDSASGQTFAWDDSSTYVRRPPYFDGMRADPDPVSDISGARVLAVLGDSATTDHISPAGAIKTDSPAGAYLQEHQVVRKDFNSYGSRRGNHEVMIRGTFANIRLRNLLAPGTEGGFTRHLPDGEAMSIFAAATRYAAERVPLIILAGAEYGSGSSRDWAAKGTLLLGVKAVLATSFERIHRSNLIGMCVLPLQFATGQSVQSLGLTGEEVYSISGLTANGASGPLPHRVKVRAEIGSSVNGIRRHRADRYAGRGCVLPPRRNPAIRSATTARPKLEVVTNEGCGVSGLHDIEPRACLSVDADRDVVQLQKLAPGLSR